MSATYTQELRRIAIETPLGPDVLLLSSFSGREVMSRLFSYDLQLLSPEPSLVAKDIVGKKVTFSVELADGSPRSFNGYVKGFASLGRGDRLSMYRAEVVPWLWFLTRTSDCRIFQDKSVPDILQQVFSELGFNDFTKGGIKGSHPKWEYCVQYRETDFNFVSRLMEHEGIFYYFKHEQGKHTLVLADQKGAYQDCEEKEVDFEGPLAGSSPLNYITSWEHRHEFRSGKWAETDYYFETPSNKLLVSTNSTVQFDGSSKYELFDYPGEYEKKADGESDIRIRIEEEEVDYETVSGSSYCRSFSPGFKFKIRKHQSQQEEGKGFVVTSVSHTATGGVGYVTGGSGSDSYSNRFNCIPDSVNFRPARLTPKPTIHGVQTAVVVGPKGEEIYPDKYNRVKVQFYWDREGKSDEKSSCWIRVATPWSGKQWGMVSVPRIGQEVVVSFLEGDPDRPLITGMVYNAETMPPYDLPGNKTQSGVKSRSSKGGGGANFNEFRFEDKKGSEEVLIHAERDMSETVEHDLAILVGHDRGEHIGHDRSLIVDHDKSETVQNDKRINVARNHSEQIGAAMSIIVGATLTENVLLNYAETVGGAMEITVGLALLITVGAAMAETIGGAKAETIGGSKVETIGASKSLSVVRGFNESIGQSRTVTIGKDLTESVQGSHSETVQKQYLLQAKKIQLVADDEISFITGDAEIIMKKNGDIMLKGNTIGIKADSNVVIKGSKILEN